MTAINKVTILGGGTAGWMCAAALSKSLSKIDITLVESEQIGTVGVGEATIPTIQFFNGLIGLDPHEFLIRTSGSYKLGIQFENWLKKDHDYFHAFGFTGKGMWASHFHNFWKKGLDQGIDAGFSDYNYEAVAAKAGKFGKEQNGLNYAYHIDASLYAKMLREIAEQNGVTRVEGKVSKVLQHQDESIQALAMENGAIIEGDLFVDCSGFTGILIDKTLKTEFVDWSHWLPMNRAIAVQTQLTDEPAPYTRSIAHHAGWQWRIPLQHRMGNGIVYCDKHMSDDEAKSLLMSSVEGEPLTEPRMIKFKTGHRKQFWNKNVVAIGLAGGFIEPLESTAIHIIQQGIQRLISFFPNEVIEQLDVDEYNQLALADYDQIKDFIILHYKLTERDDSDFWRSCKDMEIPTSLQTRIDLFAKTGRFVLREEELFKDSWLQVMIGQGVIPQSYNRLCDEMSEQQLSHFLQQIREQVRQRVARLPTHHQYLEKYCKTSQ